VSGAVTFVFSPGGVVLCALICAIAQIVRPTSPRPRYALLAVSLAYLLATIPATGNFASRVLLIGLAPFTKTAVPPGRTAIVVLGSGGLTARDWDANAYSIVDPAAASRVLEAARVFRAIDAAWVISSGGHVRLDEPDQPSGEGLRDSMVLLGVPLDRIVVETRSRNTHDEAVIVASMLPSLRVDHVVLVTSDTHMLRSLCTFRAVGIEAIPAISRDPYADQPPRTRLRPSDRGLRNFSATVHEVLGLAYYYSRGWCRF
jgi:uncharacterized SAM-binding protein YcdF (DUF218 family)